MAAPISLLHRMWRKLPAAPRRRAAARLAALVAPRSKAPVLVASEGIIVAGELTRASGLGESARLMLRGLASLGVPAWPVDVSRLLPAHRDDLPPPHTPVGLPPAGSSLVLHVNPPLLPLVLARTPSRSCARPTNHWVLVLGAAGGTGRVARRCGVRACGMGAFALLRGSA